MELDTISRFFMSVLVERKRQVELGFTVGHDDDHQEGELGALAAFYAWPPDTRLQGVSTGGSSVALWPFHPEEVPRRLEDRRTELVRAAACIVAEIERLERAA